MSIKRITASFVYTLDDDKPIRNGYVEYDEAEGTIISTGECEPGECVELEVSSFFALSLNQRGGCLAAAQELAVIDLL